MHDEGGGKVIGRDLVRLRSHNYYFLTLVVKCVGFFIAIIMAIEIVP